MKTSRFEKNIFSQPELIAGVLSAPTPKWFKPPKGRNILLVGVGTNLHAARIAAWLWSSVGLNARAVHAFDFVFHGDRLLKGDLGVFLSHRGDQSSYTVKAEAMGRRAGATTVAVSAIGAIWKGPKRRLETCALEDTGAFTKSFTTTMAWLLRWAGKPALLRSFTRSSENLRWGPAFPELSEGTDLVLLGDGLREWVAREIALKLLETAHLRVRVYGLEEFLHGPHLSVDSRSLVVGFSTARQLRWQDAHRYLKAISVPFLNVANEDWLPQIFWGQRFTLDVCRHLGKDPDLLRHSVDTRYDGKRRGRDFV